MSLSMFLGPRGDPLLPDGQISNRVKISSPILNSEEMEALGKVKGVTVQTISTLYSLKDALTQGGLERALHALCEEAVQQVKNGATVINLSDEDYMNANAKDRGKGNTVFIPPLLAVAAVHHRLIQAGLRPAVSLVVTTGQAWSTHHMACLVN